MNYDDAEMVMAKLADAYPERAISMVLETRGQNPDNPHHYRVEMLMNSNNIYTEQIKTLVDVITYVNHDKGKGERPVELKVTTEGVKYLLPTTPDYLKVVFT